MARHPDLDVSGNDTDVTGGGSCPGGCPGNGGGGGVTLPGQNGNSGDDGSGDSDSGNSGNGNNNPGSSSGNGDGQLTIDGEPWCSPGGSVDTAGEGGWTGAVGNDYGQCSWTCGGSTLTWEYNGTSDTEWRPYSATGGDTSSWDLGVSDTNGSGSAWDEYAEAFNNGTAGTPSCGDWDTSNISFSGKSRVEYICWAQLSFNGGGEGSGSSGGSGVSHGGHNFTCGGNYNVTASSSVPCPSVVRDPYPRALGQYPQSIHHEFWRHSSELQFARVVRARYP